MPRRSLFDDAPILDPWEGVDNALRGVQEERGQQKVQSTSSRLTFADWLPLVPEARGPLDLDRFPFQRELYEQHAVDDVEQVTVKATQIGESTRQIRIALFQADVRQRSVLYTFPTDTELSEFSQKRIRPVIRASEHLRSRMSSDAVDNVGQKQIGFNGWIFFRGTMKPIDSIDVDVAIFDEYDTSDQANIAASEYRVTGLMSAGLIRRIGVPSIPGYGISALYEKTDQRAWTVKCEACGEWNPIRGYESFEANVDVENMQLVCRRCRKPIDVRKGEWVATYNDRDVRGYSIPKLVVPSRRTLAGVIANSVKQKDYEVTAFFNRDLGEGYAPAEGRLSLDQVRACVRPDLRLEDPLAPAPSHALRTMGVDVASVRALNVVIEESVDDELTIGRKLWVGEVSDDPARGTAFAQLCGLMDRFGIHMAAVDYQPETQQAIAFANRYAGRVYLISFFTPGPQQKKAPEPMTVDDPEHFVSLWRTRAYDAMFARFRRQQVLLPDLDTLPPDYAAHLGHLYRRKTELERKGTDGLKVSTGNIRVDYVKTGSEDYAQAEAYNLAAIELWHRRVALELTLGAGPTPLAQLDPAAAIDDGDDYEDAIGFVEGGGPVYRSGFE